MDYLKSIRRDGDLFYTTAVTADPSLGVPCCSDWTVSDLVWHLGEVHWFWATDIEQRASDPREVEREKPARPKAYTEVIAWGRSQLDHLTQALESTADGVAVWTWALGKTDHTVGFVRRHQAQEVGVHRWDIQSAASSAIPDPIDAEIASDSIDEFLAITVPFAVNESKPLSGSVHIHCTDVPGEWYLERDGRVDRAHAEADVALRGTASDLLLALYNRVDVEALEVIGRESIARHLVERVDTT